MSCNPEVLQFTLSPQTNLLKIHCRRFLQSHSRIKFKSIVPDKPDHWEACSQGQATAASRLLYSLTDWESCIYIV